VELIAVREAVREFPLQCVIVRNAVATSMRSYRLLVARGVRESGMTLATLLEQLQEAEVLR
jgi:hypothetical protein